MIDKNKVQIKRIYERYEITTDGKVFSYCRGKRKKLTLIKNPRGYYTINIYVNKKHYVKTIHRLVAQAFIPNPNNYPQVNHIDGNKANNNLSNLEWCTNRQNHIHARDTGLKPNVCKINMEIAEEIRKLYKTRKYFQRELGGMFNLDSSTVGYIVRNKRWPK